MKNRITAAEFKEMILCASSALRKNSKLINDLNVFPVPDGDTGTNMSLTMENASEELKKHDFETIDEVASCAASGLLKGARGNSGVILSLLFRGLSKKMKGKESVDSEEFSEALSEGVDSAYKSVSKPAEGTILTVSRLSAKAALAASKLGTSIESTFESAIKAGKDALENTKNINPVLKKADVVDAGGKGFMVILESMLAYLRGETQVSDEPDTGEIASETAFDSFDPADITFTYDTVFTVRRGDGSASLEQFREYLEGIGDSLVIGEDDSVFKVHVHTDEPGAVLTEAAKYGILELAKIENMRLQHEALLSGGKARSTDDLEQVENELDEAAAGAPVPVEKEFGVVTVCAGEGIEKLFLELGADRVVTGGQTMNPSIDDIAGEINRTPASTVFVLPNNGNIILAAEQAAALSEKRVIVIPSRTVPQGISALLNFDPELQAEELVESMNDACRNVRTVLVTYAARDSEFDGRSIRAGEYLSILDGALQGSFTNLPTLFRELGWAVDGLCPEMITVYYGSDVSEDDACKAADSLALCFPDADISVVNGGQPVYYYMISLE